MLCDLVAQGRTPSRDLLRSRPRCREVHGVCHWFCSCPVLTRCRWATWSKRETCNWECFQTRTFAQHRSTWQGFPMTHCCTTCKIPGASCTFQTRHPPSAGSLVAMGVRGKALQAHCALVPTHGWRWTLGDRGRGASEITSPGKLCMQNVRSRSVWTRIPACHASRNLKKKASLAGLDASGHSL